NTQLSDLSMTSGLGQLGQLFANDNTIADVSPLSGLTSLWRLELANNQISDISPLGGLTSLWRVDLSNNQITDIAAVSAWTTMWRLDVSDNQITDLSPVSGLTSTQVMDFSGNQISDLTPLAGLSNLLRRLDLSDNDITDASPLAGVSSLNSLHLANNPMTTLDLGGANLPDLNEFHVAGNPINDVVLAQATLDNDAVEVLFKGDRTGDPGIEGIADVPGVQSLDMSEVDFSAVTDLSPLYGLDDLQTLLLIDAINPFGYGWTLPRGMAREPRGALSDADVVVITHCDRIQPERLESLSAHLERLAPQAMHCWAEHKPIAVIDEFGDYRDLSLLKGKDVYAFAAIANPEQFFQTAGDLRAELRGQLGLADHAELTGRTIESINTQAGRSGASVLLTTQKDFARLSRTDFALPLWQIAIEIDLFDSQQQLIERIARTIGEPTGLESAE
ncbi:MAG: tetraacyldisaccharide 4'-kinase, partial [Planctomycetota bacterium]